MQFWVQVKICLSPVSNMSVILFSPPHGVYQGWRERTVSQYCLCKCSRWRWKWKYGTATTRVSEKSLWLYNSFETCWRTSSSYSIFLYNNAIFDTEVAEHGILLTFERWFWGKHTNLNLDTVPLISWVSLSVDRCPYNILIYLHRLL